MGFLIACQGSPDLKVAKINSQATSTLQLVVVYFGTITQQAALLPDEEVPVSQEKLRKILEAMVEELYLDLK